MAKLTEYELKLAEVIQNANPQKGAGCSIDEMIAAMGEDGNPEKVKAALKNLVSGWYVYKMQSAHPGFPDQYYTTNKYQQEREIRWGGKRFGAEYTT